MNLGNWIKGVTGAYWKIAAAFIPAWLGTSARCRLSGHHWASGGMNGVDLQNDAMRLNHSKNAVIQSVPLHPRVKATLLLIWEARGRATRGHVFLNKHGEPYQDTRLSPIPGGNPIRRAHATALKRADIEDFTVHDWRHHWASHCVMAGIDLITVMHMGGWKSLRMVQRYATVGVDHMRAAIKKLQ